MKFNAFKNFRLLNFFNFIFLFIIELLVSINISYASGECTNKFKSENNLSKLETIYDYLNLSSSNYKFTNDDVIKLSIALRDVPDIDQQSLDKIIDIIIEQIRYDSGIWENTIRFQYNFLTPETIFDILVPIIIKYQQRVDTLVKYLTIFLNNIEIINKNITIKIRKFLLRVNNLTKLQLQKRLISYLPRLKKIENLIVVLSILSNSAYLYLKNTDELINFSYLRPILEKYLHKTNSDYIKKLAKSVLVNFWNTSSLVEEVILKKIRIESNRSYNRPRYREEVSILASLYKEIQQGRLAMDISASDITSVGCDILSVSDTKRYFIEVKSKILGSPRELTISRNEAQVALNVYKNYPEAEYKIFAVPFIYGKKHHKLPTVYEANIDWNILDMLLLRSSYESTPYIQISDFATLEWPK